MLTPIKSYDIDKIIEDYSISHWGYTENLVPSSWDNFKKWKDTGKAKPLKYLMDHRADIRSSLKNFFPDCKSSLVFLFDYSESRRALEKIFQSENHNGAKISAYTLGFDGDDYHHYIGKVLKEIQSKLESNWSISSKMTLDVHPVLERDLAHSAGLGWFGKNSMLINRQQGSFTMIGSLLLDKQLDLSKAVKELDHCGNCIACVDACPTDAIDSKTRTIEAAKCISTYTIELFKDEEPPKGMEKFSGEIFGCDICQDVCPWNNKHLDLSTFQGNDNFWNEGQRSFIKDNFLLNSISNLNEKLMGLSNREYRRWLAGTSFERLGRIGLLKNLKTFLRFRKDTASN